MSPALILTTLLVTLVLLVTTVAVLQQNVVHRRQLLAAVDARASWRTNLLDRVDSRFRGTRWGGRIGALLAGSGLVRWTPTVFVLVVVGAALLAALLTWAVAGRIAGLLAAVIVVVSARRWLQRRREARIERFIGQLPELARLLANGAQAGLGVRRSMELAAREMEEPASTELGQVGAEL
ncbi:MAG: hypothetical protein J0I87_11555, partial [Cellulomonas sp.]|nr:hypothetical protein [Cellulomonas sp.]